jgi:HSP20 family protein
LDERRYIMIKTTNNTGNKGEVRVRKPGDGMAQTGDSKSLHLFEEVDRLFESLMARGWLRPLHWDIPLFEESRMPFEGKVPRVDVIDRKKEVVIRAEIPGVDKRDLDISMTDTAVTIKGTSSHEKKEEKDDYYRREIAKGSFSRTVPLPDNVDGGKARASFRDGVLELTVPKVKDSKRHSIKL